MKCFFCTLLFMGLLTGCNKDYTSKDLQTFNLYGKVKSVTTFRLMNVDDIHDDRFGTTWNFDITGMLSTSEVFIERDDEGYISTVKYDDFGGFGFKYDNNHNVIEQYNWDTSTLRECPIKSDKKKNPIESEQYGEISKEEGASPEATLKYEYLSMDAKGNWTLRKVTYTNLYGYENARTWYEKRIVEY